MSEESTPYSEVDALLATHSETDAQVAFRLLDLDGDGLLSREELQKYYEPKANSAAIEELMRHTNQNGLLTEAEFVAYHTFSPDQKFERLLCQYGETHSAECMEAMFRLIDTNSDGVISKSELAASYLVRGTPNEEAATSLMMATGDLNQDGVLSLEEFKKLVGETLG